MVGDLNPILIDMGAGGDAVVEQVFFKGEAIRACPEDVAELDSTIPANVVIDMERSSPNGKAVVKALIDIGAPMQSQVTAGTRRRGAGVAAGAAANTGLASSAATLIKVT